MKTFSTLTLILLLGSLLAQADVAPERAWTKRGFKNVQLENLTESQIYPDDQSTVWTHSFPMTLVLFRNTDWTKDFVLDHVQKAAQVLKKCGLKIAQADLVTADPYLDQVNVEKEYRGIDLAISKATPVTAKPIIYFMKENRSDGGSPGGYATPWFWVNPQERWNIASAAPMLNSIFLFSYVNSEEYKKLGELEYEVLAHELVHVLGDLRHVVTEEPNLMNGKDNTLTSDQCQAVLSSQLVSKIK